MQVVHFLGQFGAELARPDGSGVGVLILFRHRSSVGGVNIIGLEVQDRTGFRAGWTMMIFDLLIILAAVSDSAVSQILPSPHYQAVSITYHAKP